MFPPPFSCVAELSLKATRQMIYFWCLKRLLCNEEPGPNQTAEGLCRWVSSTASEIHSARGVWNSLLLQREWTGWHRKKGRSKTQKCDCIHNHLAAPEPSLGRAQSLTTQAADLHQHMYDVFLLACTFLQVLEQGVSPGAWLWDPPNSSCICRCRACISHLSFPEASL